MAVSRRSTAVRACLALASLPGPSPASNNDAADQSRRRRRRRRR
ncbi:hypothetical protein [Nonomuraea sp. NPDC050783]